MKKKLYLNNIVSLLYQITSVIAGLIIPRLLLRGYGSAINGYVSSITRMLGFISILDLGVGSVVQAALYKPLANKDEDEISKIYSAAKKYFRIIARILLLYILLLVIYYCYSQKDNFSYLFSASLILAIAISSFSQYYFGICLTLVLNADQKNYIVTTINLVTLVINTIFTIVLINNGFSIQVVKLVTSLIYLVRPVLLSVYIKNHYSIHFDKKVNLSALDNKWSGMAQHISTVLTGSIDYVVLTVFSTMQMISVYTVYVLPLNSIRDLINALCAGYKSYFGNLLAENKIELVKRDFNYFESIIHLMIVLIYGSTVKLIVPFVLLYTKGVSDTAYTNYIFAYFIIGAYALFALRVPYTTLIFSAGHFKETQSYCIIESALNSFISIALVNIWGITGVAVGTCISVAYRLIASEKYLENNIISRNPSIFIKHIFVDIISIVVYLFAARIISYTEIGIISWVVYSIKNLALNFVIIFTINFVLYNKETKEIIQKIGKRL